MNPAVLDAFALAIIAGEGAPAFPGMTGHEPDQAKGDRYAERIAQATQALRAVVPNAGTYLSESNFFEGDWQHANWGSNHARLAAVKRQYDSDGLFFVHHGVSSELWSADGFTRVKSADGRITPQTFNLRLEVFHTHAAFCKMIQSLLRSSNALTQANQMSDSENGDDCIGDSTDGI
ncbi:MAG: hypothetical protein QOC89_2456 [Paraburkholderia sp.]|jgi:hypothetical protein|uniref:BBE domain-containing protein n=1 Tax=Paraburkholderia sp. TaxID=1926495 RepID=UPI002AFEE208|nr:BBE domain-containing protein [Paraburkholderia sp.]MEA3084759.1 hypothetical protein [Paraburkholderia sp.]